MAVNAKYKQFITEYTKQQMVILGPSLAVDTANRVNGLEVNDRGQVTGLVGDEVLVFQAFLNEFTKLSPQLASFVANSMYERFSDIAEQYPDSIKKIQLTCTLMKPKS